MDKEEIIARSRRIGTYDLSAKVREYCSISSGRPATAASPESVLREETGLDPAVLESSLETSNLFDLRGLDMVEVAGESVFVDGVPEGAAVIDTRSPESYRVWHWRGAEHREYSELMTDYEHLSRDVTYVLYCEFGLKSARVAELMQRSGYEAYSVLGGVKGLRRHASSEHPIRPVTSGPVGGTDND